MACPESPWLGRTGERELTEQAVNENCLSVSRASEPDERAQLDWPELGSLRLAPSARASRRQYIGGSDANIILSGNPDRVRDLWLEKRGDREPEELSDKLAVMLGCWTEPFNRHWYQKLSGEMVSRSGESITSPGCNWRRCTLDGFVDSQQAVWEAKHTSAFAKLDEVLDRYMPQLQHNMLVVGASRAILSVIFGNHKYEIIEVGADWLYQQELLDAEAAFWECVQSGRPPVAVATPPAPRPIGTREVCFEGNNAWAFAAIDWRQHRQAAKDHAAATGIIKSLIEEDVARAFGHGIEAKKSKNGAITIREFAQ